MGRNGSPPGKKNIKPDKELFEYWCRRWGYTPVGEEIGTLLGVTPRHALDAVRDRGFQDKDKMAIAKAFELTAQEFVDLFYPGYFRDDGNIKLDREVKYRGVKEKAFDVFPWTTIK